MRLLTLQLRTHVSDAPASYLQASILRSSKMNAVKRPSRTEGHRRVASGLGPYRAVRHARHQTYSLFDPVFETSASVEATLRIGFDFITGVCSPPRAGIYQKHAAPTRPSRPGPTLAKPAAQIPRDSTRSPTVRVQVNNSKAPVKRIVEQSTGRSINLRRTSVRPGRTAASMHSFTARAAPHLRSIFCASSIALASALALASSDRRMPDLNGLLRRRHVMNTHNLHALCYR